MIFGEYLPLTGIRKRIDSTSPKWAFEELFKNHIVLHTLSQLGMLQHEWGRLLFRFNPVHVVDRDGATLVSMIVAKPMKKLSYKVNLQSSILYSPRFSIYAAGFVKLRSSEQ